VPKIRLRPLSGRRFRRTRARPLSQTTALDVDATTLRLVQAIPRGQRSEITRVAALAMELTEADRADPALLGQAMARALAQAGLKPSSVIMGVPRAQVVLRELTLPALEDVRELASMVHFQVGRDLPFRLDEAVVDFKVRRGIRRPALEVAPTDAVSAKTDASAAAKVEVLVAAVRREVVEFYRQTCEAAGLKLAALGLLSYGNVRCAEACRVTDDEKPFALVSLRPDEMSIDVIARQSLLFSRGAAIKLIPEPPAAPAPEAAAGDETTAPAAAAADVPRPATYAEAATIEVVRSLHSYAGMEPQSAGKIVVAGASGHEAAVVEALSKRLSIPCEVLDPSAALDLHEDAREHATGTLAAIGLALGLGDADGLPFDFLNPKQPAVPRDLRRIRILAGVATAAAMLVFILTLRTSLINQRERVRRDLAAELAEAEKKSPFYRRMTQQAGSVEDWVKGNANWLDHYAYLSAILPASEEVYLTSLTVGGPGVIRLAVQARSGEILAKLDKHLRAAGYDVKPLAITPGADRYGYEFRSTVELIAPERMKIDLSKVKTPARPADDASLEHTAHKGGGG
jgi:type IV pilus assembly protein PilM